jgi:hypothetical protein
MNIPDHFSDSLETVFRVKIPKFVEADPDPGSGIFFTLDPGSGINIQDPQLVSWVLLPTREYVRGPIKFTCHEFPSFWANI